MIINESYIIFRDMHKTNMMWFPNILMNLHVMMLNKLTMNRIKTKNRKQLFYSCQRMMKVVMNTNCLVYMAELMAIREMVRSEGRRSP